MDVPSKQADGETHLPAEVVAPGETSSGDRTADTAQKCQQERERLRKEIFL